MDGMVPRMRFSVLASGSAANSTFLEAGDTRLLIDCGLSARQVGLRLHGLGIDIKTVQGILLTHEHSDHIAGLRVLSNRMRLPVYTTEETAAQVDGLFAVEHIHPGKNFSLGDLTIHPFRIPHDAVNPVGFAIEGGGFRFVQATDLGKVTPNVEFALRGANALVLESNHDRELLRSCDYPWSLKQRIASAHGHLSNDAMAEALGGCAHSELSVVVLGHLSENSNTPSHAIAAGTRALADHRSRGYTATLTSGSVYAATPLFCVEQMLEGMAVGE